MRYHGGHAVAAHGFPRATQDVDLVLALTSENSAAAIEALEEIGYAPRAPVPAKQFCDPATRRAWMTEKGALVFQMFSRNPLELPVDLFVTEPFDFDREYAVAEHIEISEGVVAQFVSLPTLLAMKKEAGRAKDLEDIAALETLHRQSLPGSASGPRLPSDNPR